MARRRPAIGAVAAAKREWRAQQARALSAPRADRTAVGARHRAGALPDAQHRSQPHTVDLPQARRLLTPGGDPRGARTRSALGRLPSGIESPTQSRPLLRPLLQVCCSKAVLPSGRRSTQWSSRALSAIVARLGAILLNRDQLEAELFDALDVTVELSLVDDRAREHCRAGVACHLHVAEQIGEARIQLAADDETVVRLAHDAAWPAS